MGLLASHPTCRPSPTPAAHYYSHRLDKGPQLAGLAHKHRRATLDAAPLPFVLRQGAKENDRHTVISRHRAPSGYEGFILHAGDQAIGDNQPGKREVSRSGHPSEKRLHIAPPTQDREPTRYGTLVEYIAEEEDVSGVILDEHNVYARLGRRRDRSDGVLGLILAPGLAVVANFFSLFEELPRMSENGVSLRYRVPRSLARLLGVLPYVL